MQTWPRHHQVLLLLTTLVANSLVYGHNLANSNAIFLENLEGASVFPLLYLGAKHMVTGVDHLLYLLAVVFFLQRVRDVLIFATLFTLGHSITLLAGVMFELNVNVWLIDAIIGLSIVYKSFENLEGFKYLIPFKLNPLVAVFGFGLCHGFGLASKMQSIALPKDGLLTNILSFNLGVELGQFLALSVIIVLILYWRNKPGFAAQAFTINGLIMLGGFLLTGYHLTGYTLQVAS